MSAVSVRMYRAMLPEPATTPVVPAVGTENNLLGARVHPHPRPDVTPDARGDVGPVGKGLSVAPSLEAMPAVLVPERLRDKRPGARASNAVRVFRLGEGSFVRAPVGASLELAPTKPTHGVVQPREPTPLAAYQEHLAATQALWVVDER